MFRKSNKAGVIAVGSALAVMAGNAAAVVDTVAINAAISEGQAAAVVVALAFGIAIWAVRGVKLIRRA